MEFYTYALFLHIVGVLGMFMAVGLEEAALLRLRSAKTTALVREWMRVMNVVEKMFPISAVIILVAGLYMAFTTWGWSHAWIDVSLGAFLLTSAMAPAITTPGFKAIHKALASAPDGPLSAELWQRIHASKLRTAILVMDFLTLGIVCLMTLKPGWIESLGVMAVAFVVAMIVAHLPSGATRPASSSEQLYHEEQTLEEAGVR